MHHAGNVKGNFGEHKIAYNILCTQNQTKHDLTDEQQHGKGKVRFGNRLTLVFHDVCP